MRVAMLGIFALLLSSCGAAGDVALWVKTAHSTASGAVTAVRHFIELSKSIKQGAEDTAEDLKHRAAKVQSGVELMLQGKEMIEGAVK